MARRHGEYASVRDAILASASKLFTQMGVHGTSLNDIAVDAGLSKGTLYYYYPTKEQLVSDIAAYAIAARADIIFTWVESLSREQRLDAALTSLFSSIAADTRLAKLHVVLNAEAATGNAELSSMLAGGYREWAVMLEVGALKLQGQNAKVLRKRSNLFFVLLDGYIVQSLGNLCDSDVSMLVEAVLK